MGRDPCCTGSLRHDISLIVTLFKLRWGVTLPMYGGALWLHKRWSRKVFVGGWAMDIRFRFGRTDGFLLYHDIR